MAISVCQTSDDVQDARCAVVDVVLADPFLLQSLADLFAVLLTPRHDQVIAGLHTEGRIGLSVMGRAPVRPRISEGCCLLPCFFQIQ